MTPKHTFSFTTWVCVWQQISSDRNPDDIDKAIFFHEAQELMPDDPVHDALYIGSLARSLKLRGVLRGTISDIERAVELAETAECLTPADHLQKSSRLDLLGTVLAARLDFTQSIGDIDRAIAAQKEASGWCQMIILIVLGS